MKSKVVRLATIHKQPAAHMLGPDASEYECVIRVNIDHVEITTAKYTIVLIECLVFKFLNEKKNNK